MYKVVCGAILYGSLPLPRPRQVAPPLLETDQSPKFEGSIHFPAFFEYHLSE